MGAWEASVWGLTTAAGLGVRQRVAGPTLAQYYLRLPTHVRSGRATPNAPPSRARRPQGERIGGGDGASAVERLARRVVLSLASGSTKIDTVDCVSWNFPDRWASCSVKAILGGGCMKSSVDPLKEARNSRDLARRAIDLPGSRSCGHCHSQQAAIGSALASGLHTTLQSCKTTSSCVVAGV